MSDLIKREDTKCDKRNCPFVGAEDCKMQDCKYRTEQKVCEDAISREWMLNEFVTHAYDIIYDINSHEKGMSLTGIRQVIESAPSVTPKVPKGEWIAYKGMQPPEFHGRHYCSNCYHAIHLLLNGGTYNFCPNCGADMRGEQTNLQTDCPRK